MLYWLFVACFGSHQVVKLIDVFPYGTGFVLVFEYMLSDLSEVLRNSTRPLTEVRILYVYWTGAWLYIQKLSTYQWFDNITGR